MRRVRFKELPPGVDPEQRELQEGLAELEFRADLEPEMDDLAALGYQPGKARAVFTQLFDEGGELAGLYNPPTRSSSEGDRLSRLDIIQRQTEDTMRVGDVIVSRDFLDDKDIWAHEFRHRGLNTLRTTFSRDEFSERYGEDAATFLYDEQENEETIVDNMSGTPHNGPDNIGAERSAALTKVLTSAALDVIENDRDPANQKEAVSWLRRLFGGKE